MSGKSLPSLAGPRGPVSSPEPWYADGVHFACQQSGRCCTNRGEYAYVYLTAQDERALAGHLELRLASFRRLYTELVDGWRALRSEGDACVFLEGARCRVHEAKPRQCRTWPFWRENLEERVWRDEVAPFCAGVGKGRLWTREEIEEQAWRVEDEDGQADLSRGARRR